MKREFTAASPPAIWAAFANASRWKSWALLAQFALNGLLLLVAMRLAKMDPDVVVVAEDGKSTYVPRAASSTIAGSTLVRFLEEEKQKPSDLTVLRFTREFLDTFFAVNSSTLDGAFPKALSMMDARLRQAIQKEYADGKVLETYRLAQIRSRLTIDELLLVQKTDLLIHLKARLTRTRSSLLDASKPSPEPSVDGLEVELVERVVPRTPVHPDGLELAEVAVRRSDKAAETQGKPAAGNQASAVPALLTEAPHDP